MKRGQITVFIILGLIILIGIGVFLYIRTSVDPITGGEEKPKTPVDLFVSECLESTAVEAIQLLGTQSGYTEIPEDILSDSQASFNLDQAGAVKMPYWFARGIDKRLTEEQIAEQIGNYIDKNLDSCTQNFTTLENVVIVEQLSNPKTSVELNPDRVDINLNLKLRAISPSGESVQNLEDFSTIVNIDLKRIIELARQIMLVENRDGFIEETTIDLMSADPSIPITGFELHCRRLQWDLNDIQKNLSNTLSEIIPFTRFQNTNYIPFRENEEIYKSLQNFDGERIFNGETPQEAGLPNPPSDAWFYNNLFFNLSNEDYSDLGVNVNYRKEWGLDIYSRPSRNGIMQANRGSGYRKYLSYLCINTYHFTYDVVYPVVFSVRDDTAFNNEGYVFSFATPIIIDHNEPSRAAIEGQFYNAPVFDAEFCRNKGNQQYTIKAIGNADIGGEGFTNVELRDVEISYDCIKYSCPLNVTKGEGVETKLVTTIPQSCSGGFFVAEKNDYVEARVQVNNQFEYEIEMQKLKNLSLTIEKYHSGSLQQIDLAETDTVVLTFLHNESDFSSTILIGSEIPETFVQLVDDDASYEVQAYLLNEETDELLGGYIANWTHTYLESSSSNEMVFKVAEFLPRNPLDDEFQFKMFQYLESNQTYKDQLRPVLR